MPEFNRNNLRMHPRPGKFEGGLFLAEVLYNAAPDWCAEEYYGITGGDCHVVLLHGPFDLSGEAWEALNDDERNYVRSLAGVILFEDSHGSVSTFYYTERNVLDKAWADALKDPQESSEPSTGRIERDDSEDGYAVILTGVPPSEKLRGKPKKAPKPKK